MSEEKHLFYGFEVVRNEQQRYINRILSKFNEREVNDELKKEIWNLLQQEKYKGNVTIPFKVTMRRDPQGKNPNYIEVTLDTKV